jgi:nucleoid DNA-binding protein
MNQKELIKVLSEKVELPQVKVKEMLDAIEETIDAVVLEGKTLKVMGLKFEKKEKPRTQGVVKMASGEEVEWCKEAHTYPSVKYLKSKRDELSRNI